MGWFSVASKSMPIPEALRYLGFNPDAKPTPEQIKANYREMAKKFHPDVAGPHHSKTMAFITNAYEALKNFNFGKKQDWHEYVNNRQPKERSPWPKEKPPWQTDTGPGTNTTGSNNFGDINFCKKSIYEYSLSHGGEESIKEYWILAFDGEFFRGSFIVKTNESSLMYAAGVMQNFNSRANPYKTVAVIGGLRGGNGTWRVLQVNGRPDGGELGGTDNPVNDRRFKEILQKYIQKITQQQKPREWTG